MTPEWQHGSKIYTLDELMALYGRPRFFIYSACVVSSLALILLYIRWVEQTYREFTSDGMERYTYKNGGRVHLLHRFLYPAASGIMGAQNVLFGVFLSPARPTFSPCGPLACP